MFDGQVLTPLCQRLAQNPLLTITLLSFEKKRLFAKDNPILTAKVTEIQRLHPRLQLVIRSKTSFFGRCSLIWPLYQLRKFLAQHNFDQVLIRGPLAGYLWYKARTASTVQLNGLLLKPTPVTIQARGLAAAEYAYEHRLTPSYSRLWHRWRADELERIERLVYGPLALLPLPYQIEAVSPALKTHLAQHYHTDPHQLTIAQQDLPAPLDPQQVANWRQQIRMQLKLAPQQTVYCYSGSAKAWQCPRETIQYFQTQLAQNQHSILLILTPDLTNFQALLTQSNLPHNSYRLLCVPHREVYQYLAACDVGIVFREAHILNWISRPTKILEYQSVGLQIVHNHTIAMLSELG